MSGLFGSDSETTQKWEPPDFTKPFWEEGVKSAHGIYGQYGKGDDLSWQGPFASKATDEQVAAMKGLSAMSLPYQDDANQQAIKDQWTARMDTTQKGLTGGMVNPYMGQTNAYAGATNAYGGASNPFGGESNPAFEKMLASTRQGMEDSFARGTAANTNAAAARSGAFGGSGHNELAAVQGGELAKQVAGMESGMRNDQFNRAAGLWGEDINRNANLWGQDIGRNAGIWGQDIGRNAGLAETGFGRQLQTLGMLPSLQAGDVNMLNSLLSGGELFRGLDQKELEGQIGRHQQNVQQPIAALNILLDALARASGGGGTASTITRGGGLFGS